ncbi:MAG TPA: MscL family protein [Candidatus Saccharimonadales bacterium]
MAKRNPDRSVTHVVTPGSTIRFEQPKSSRGQTQQQPKIVITAPDIHPVSGFVDFLREHAVVGLAIGFVIGTQVQTLVKQLVSSFIDPLFQLLFGHALSQQTSTLHWHGRAASFGWGAFVYGVLDFIFVLAAVYAIIKFLNLDELDKPKKKPKKNEKDDLEIQD